jgi:hypothetical protein
MEALKAQFRTLWRKNQINRIWYDYFGKKCIFAAVLEKDKKDKLKQLNYVFDKRR